MVKITTEPYDQTAQEIFGVDEKPQDDELPVEILQSRAAFLKEAILHVIRQIRERRWIRDENLYRINTEECHRQTSLFQLPTDLLGIDKNLDRVRSQLETELQRLELEKGKENSGFWKDITTLQSDLIELSREYRQLLEKLEVLTGHSYPRPSFTELLKLTERPEPVEEPLEPPSEFEVGQLRRVP